MNDSVVHQFLVVANPTKGWGVVHNELELRTGKFLKEVKAPTLWFPSPEAAWGVASSAALDWSETEMYVTVQSQSEGGDEDPSPICRYTIYHNWSSGYQINRETILKWSDARGPEKEGFEPVFEEISTAWGYGFKLALEALPKHSRVELRLEFL